MAKKKGKDPAFLWYPNDYVGGTMGMSFEEKGAYVDLLMMQFNRGHMTSHMCGQVCGQIWERVKHKFIQDDNGLWYNERLEIEQKNREAFTMSRRNNLLGENQFPKNGGHMDPHMVGQVTSHMENENINEGINDSNGGAGGKEMITFEMFWDLYDKKVDKKKTIEKWAKVKESDREVIMQHIPRYKKAQPNKQYRKDPATYLHNRSWENEIITPVTNQPKLEILKNGIDERRKERSIKYSGDAG